MINISIQFLVEKKVILVHIEVMRMNVLFSFMLKKKRLSSIYI
jgi:hypothetical protein